MFDLETIVCHHHLQCQSFAWQARGGDASPTEADQSAVDGILMDEVLHNESKWDDGLGMPWQFWQIGITKLYASAV